MPVIRSDSEPSAPSELQSWLEFRRRMLLSEVEWIESVLHVRPKTSELRHERKREKIVAEQS